MNFIFYSIIDLKNVIVDFIMYKSDIQIRKFYSVDSDHLSPNHKTF